MAPLVLIRLCRFSVSFSRQSARRRLLRGGLYKMYLSVKKTRSLCKTGVKIIRN